MIALIILLSIVAYLVIGAVVALSWRVLVLSYSRAAPGLEPIKKENEFAVFGYGLAVVFWPGVLCLLLIPVGFGVLVWKIGIGIMGIGNFRLFK